MWLGGQDRTEKEMGLVSGAGVYLAIILTDGPFPVQNVGYWCAHHSTFPSSIALKVKVLH